MNSGITTTVGLTVALLVLFMTYIAGNDLAGAQELRDKKQQNLEILDGINRQISLGEEKVNSLRQEIASLKQDRAGISKALVAVAKRTRELELRLDEIERQISVLGTREQEIKKSLFARRDLLSRVLAALQRMGRNPPPALLVRPDDALASVRSAVLLGAVVPELRAETGILIVDLQELARLRAEILDQRKKHDVSLKSLAEEDLRLSLLVDKKLKTEGQSRQAIEIQQNKSRILVEKAKNLKQLIASLSARIEENERAAKIALEKEQARKTAENNRLSAARNRFAEGRAKIGSQFGQIVQQSRFSEAKGGLKLPVTGVEVMAFGEKTGSGSRSNGSMMATRVNALVVSPFDARVVYAGPFRSYGQLLILDVGEKVHIVLAGMDKLNVDTGQIVLAGEPVAKMGTRRIASVAPRDIASSRPMLYVEFRKDGKPFDPTPWWTESSIKRSGNDS